MSNLKHVGRMADNGAKVIVVFRTLPDDPHSALVVGTTTLSESYHNSLIELVDSIHGQQSREFGNIMSTRYFADGRIMLSALHQDGKLVKVATKDVTMTPSLHASINLSELNNLIAEQEGVRLEDLALMADNSVTNIASAKEVPVSTVAKVEENVAPTVPETPIEVAQQLREQANLLLDQAEKLRLKADSLDPVKQTIPVKRTKAASKTTETA